MAAMSDRDLASLGGSTMALSCREVMLQGSVIGAGLIATSVPSIVALARDQLGKLCRHPWHGQRL
jgi:hypothetical protein